eukprot:TRINITY_DN11858_c0_g1_i1.p1 TRINITY_DN11858_c0_g1~~TRINITY_DN11858_c0_g1_i1.p1  ORF type:complete len:102 (+),score=23.66 TRINITY_DN11858_c0_g1_i1:145-450(+)
MSSALHQTANLILSSAAEEGSCDDLQQLVMDDLKQSGKLRELERRCEELLQATNVNDFDRDKIQMITEVSRLMEGVRPSEHVMNSIRSVVTKHNSIVETDD